MNREIKFRGKRIDNGEWVYGNLLYTESCIGTITDCRIVDNYEQAGSDARFIEAFTHEVNPETVGQWTGLTDKNGKEIYEGDIMPVWEKGQESCYKVIYDGDCFMLSMLDSKQGSYPLSTKTRICEVKGNIHDNPELLEATP